MYCNYIQGGKNCKNKSIKKLLKKKKKKRITEMKMTLEGPSSSAYRMWNGSAIWRTRVKTIQQEKKKETKDRKTV